MTGPVIQPNSDELRNVIKSMLEMSPQDELSTEVFPYIVSKNPPSVLDELDYHAALAQVDEYFIRKVLKDSGSTEASNDRR